MHLLIGLAALCSADAIPTGAGRVTFDVDAAPFELFTYKPEAYTDGPLILVFHGVLRNAEDYRDHAKGMAERFKALVVAPKFPEAKYPIESYQLGGLILKGEVQPPERWTWRIVPRIVAEVRRRENRPEMPHYLIGHSGGGQFLIRYSGFLKTDARRIVVSNPGTYLFPTREAKFPYGYGGLPETIASDAALQAFLAQPLTLYLAAEDKERDEYFDVTPPAEAQGKTRIERGKHAFTAAQRLAAEKGWKCHWKLIVVDGVGHDHERMFDHARCAEALFGAVPPEAK